MWYMQGLQELRRCDGKRPSASHATYQTTEQLGMFVRRLDNLPAIEILQDVYFRLWSKVDVCSLLLS